MSNSFGKNLRELMKQRNISGRQLALKIGIAHKSIQEWVDSEKPSYPRNPNVLKELATFFDVTVYFLLFGAEDPKSLIGDILEKTELHTGMYEITVRKVKTKGSEK